MQGAAAEESIVAALCAVAERMDEFDAVVLIRGGGSASDLNCFNAYRLCAHVAQFPLPILTGIGHDKDTSVADMVAHTALKTPTAVAGWLVERMTQAEGWLDYAALQLHDATKAAMHASEVRLERLTGDLRQMSGNLLTRQRLRAEHLSALLPEAVRNFLARQATRLDNAAELIAGRSPERILRLGFAVVRTAAKPSCRPAASAKATPSKSKSPTARSTAPHNAASRNKTAAVHPVPEPQNGGSKHTTTKNRYGKERDDIRRSDGRDREDSRPLPQRRDGRGQPRRRGQTRHGADRRLQITAAQGRGGGFQNTGIVMSGEIVIRETVPADLAAIVEVHKKGFGYDKEAGLTAELLSDPTAEPAVSLARTARRGGRRPHPIHPMPHRRR